jgi:hypothetical protein
MNLLGKTIGGALAIAALLPFAGDGRSADGETKPASVRSGLEFSGQWEIESSSLKDALNFIAERIGIPILVDRFAFAGIGIQDVESQKVTITKLQNVPARDVLRLLLSQVGGDFLVDDGHLVVVPQQYMAAERLVRRPVDITLENTTLAATCQRLSEVSGISIVLDSRCTDKAKVAVSGSFQHVPLETVVRILADMADLKAVAMDNVLYLTTKANAQELQAEQDGRYHSRPLVPTFGESLPGLQEPATKARTATLRGSGGGEK